MDGRSRRRTENRPSRIGPKKLNRSSLRNYRFQADPIRFQAARAIPRFLLRTPDSITWRSGFLKRFLGKISSFLPLFCFGRFRFSLLFRFLFVAVSLCLQSFPPFSASGAPPSASFLPSFLPSPALPTFLCSPFLEWGHRKRQRE